ncbi:2Fe-2S iron-sulfur cluster-binding protein [Pseudonocardia acidicola]|uniref:2Fe-2S iron-sulfur cluster binding domain-containing protein n=1 Tax=Pseudonocardia acidicola TaxID=2724939 RepID=A0ABX1SK09_9PSEU|nr:2Fe-2S iron-sulfur cluster-binding protein [Pseudonocardia acidicola]NMI01862.1 2Fe-2S iron-sulfur cluster binding domain-containing protein [Pseudonocardia acidicola]
MHRLLITDVRRLTADAVCITFAVPDELHGEYHFRPGQHVVLARRVGDEEIRRTYSICSPAGGPLRVAVKHLPGGAFSTWATTELRAGDALGVMTPTGRFSLDLLPSHVKHYVAIAAGSGITPILSNIATVLEVERRSRVTLVYANRTHESTMFRDELEDLRERHPGRFALRSVFSRESSRNSHLHGRLTGAWLRELLDNTIPVPDVDEWLLCGPSALVAEVTSVLTVLGVPAHSVHRELFTADNSGEPGGPRDDAVVESDVTVVLNGKRTSFHIGPSDGPILDALLQLRPDAPYACREGVCAICRVRAVEGDVTMRRSSGLEPGELRAGYVLACQAQPASQRVVLDFDA